MNKDNFTTYREAEYTTGQRLDAIKIQIPLLTNYLVNANLTRAQTKRIFAELQYLNKYERALISSGLPRWA